MENRFQNFARKGIVEHQFSYPVSGEIAFGIAYLNAQSLYNILLYNEIAVRQSSGFEIVTELFDSQPRPKPLNQFLRNCGFAGCNTSCNSNGSHVEGSLFSVFTVGRSTRQLEDRRQYRSGHR